MLGHYLVNVGIVYYLHGVINGVLGIVSIVLLLVEDSGRSIQLQLELGGQSALEVNSPQGLSFADGNTFNL